MNDTTSGSPNRPPHDSELGQAYGRRSSRQRASSGLSPFAPMLILLLGMVAWSGFQLQHLMTEADALAAARAGQETQVQQAQKVRQALDAVANETRKLADAGNANARTVVDELRKRGVTINPATGAQPAK
jgi:hypothetical protein